MGIFSGKGFVGSCFRGWGSSNMAVQAVGCMIGMVVLVFVVLWYVVKFCLRIFDKHREKEESSRSVQNITMEMGYPNFNLGNYSVVLEQSLPLSTKTTYKYDVCGEPFFPFLLVSSRPEKICLHQQIPVHLLPESSQSGIELF